MRSGAAGVRTTGHLVCSRAACYRRDARIPEKKCTRTNFNEIFARPLAAAEVPENRSSLLTASEFHSIQLKSIPLAVLLLHGWDRNLCGGNARRRGR